MFPQLNDILDININSLESGKCILIDEKGSDGSFILHHFMSMYLRHSHKVCLVSVAQSFSHFINVGNKLGLNLSSEKEKGNLFIIEGLKSIGNEIVKLVVPDVNEPSVTLAHRLIDFSSQTTDKQLHNEVKPLYDSVLQVIQSVAADDHLLLIIDDLSVLCALGVSSLALTYFVKYLQNIISDNSIHSKVTLLLLMHNVSGVDDHTSHQLLTYMSHNSDVIITTESLQSGISDAVDGQMAISWRNLASGITEKEKKMHYKIKDKTVNFFPLGMSSAVL